MPSGKSTFWWAPTTSLRPARPRVYVYNLPPRFVGFYNKLEVDRAVDELFHSRLLTSEYRVANGDDAELFFVPVSARKSGPADGAGHHIIGAAEWVKQTFPWWNKHDGADHMFIVVGDYGTADHLRRVPPLLSKVIWLQHDGATERNGHFNPSKDVVVPPIQGGATGFTPKDSPLFGGKKQKRDTLFFYAGAVVDNVAVERGNVRKAVVDTFKDTPGIVVRDTKRTKIPNYKQMMARSVFCLGPAGQSRARHAGSPVWLHPCDNPGQHAPGAGRDAPIRFLLCDRRREGRAKPSRHTGRHPA